MKHSLIDSERLLIYLVKEVRYTRSKYRKAQKDKREDVIIRCWSEAYQNAKSTYHLIRDMVRLNSQVPTFNTIQGVKRAKPLIKE